MTSKTCLCYDKTKSDETFRFHHFNHWIMAKCLYLLSIPNLFYEVKHILRKIVFQKMIVSELHQQSPQQVASYELVIHMDCAPSVNGPNILSPRLVFHNVEALSFPMPLRDIYRNLSRQP